MGSGESGFIEAVASGATNGIIDVVYRNPDTFNKGALTIGINNTQRSAEWQSLSTLKDTTEAAMAEVRKRITQIDKDLSTYKEYMPTKEYIQWVVNRKTHGNDDISNESYFNSIGLTDADFSRIYQKSPTFESKYDAEFQEFLALQNLDYNYNLNVKSNLEKITSDLTWADYKQYDNDPYSVPHSETINANYKQFVQDVPKILQAEMFFNENEKYFPNLGKDIKSELDWLGSVGYALGQDIPNPSRALQEGNVGQFFTGLKDDFVDSAKESGDKFMKNVITDPYSEAKDFLSGIKDKLVLGVEIGGGVVVTILLIWAASNTRFIISGNK